MYMTAMLVLSMHWSDIPLQTAGQTQAPVCVEYCEGGQDAKQ